MEGEKKQIMIHQYQDFQKGDKRLLQALISTGVQREIEHFSKKMAVKFNEMANATHEDIRVPYWKLQEEFKTFNKHLTRTYDGYSHRDIPMILAGLVVKGILKDSDFADFSEQGKELMKETVDALR